MIVTRLAVCISLLTTTGVVLLLAQPRGRERSFLIHLGRRVQPADLAWARGVQLFALLIGFIPIGALFWGREDEVAAYVIATTSAQMFALGVGTWRAVLTSRLPSPSAQYAVPLDAPFRMRDLASPFWQAANLCLVVGCFAAFVSMVDRLPPEIPVKFRWDGTAVRWTAPGELWMCGYLMLFHTVLMGGVFAGIANERVALSPSSPEAHLALHRTHRLLLARLIETALVGANALVGALWIGLSLHGLSESPTSTASIMLLAGIGGAVVVIGPLAYFVPRLMRVQDQLRVVGGSHVLGTRADGWVFFGFFYFAPDDPAVVVPKKHGIGQTLNFARPVAWVVLLVLFATPLIIVGLVRQ